MSKVSSVESSALEAGYLLELEKISKASKAKDVAYSLGSRLRDIVDLPGKGGGVLSDIYDAYAKGYQKTPRGLKDSAKALGKDIPAAALMIPLGLTTGTAVGVAAKPKLKKKEPQIVPSLEYGDI